MIHQEGHLAGVIAAADTVHIPEIGLIHADQEIVFVVIPVRQLPHGVTATGDAMLRQLALCRRIDWVADFLSARGCRFDMVSPYPEVSLKVDKTPQILIYQRL